MLAKLSFRNAKRQAHDYIIYFVTLTAIFSLIHGLNSLLFAEDDIFPLDDSTFILPMILISSLLSALLNGEPLFEWQYIAALALVCVGIFLVNRAPQEAKA